MANYPTSVYNPASKSAGQTITAAMYNDPESEIIAIETGLLQGTAPLNSSNSTHANLSVTGGSTLAKLEVSGGSTLATINISGGSTFAVRPTTPPPDAALVYAPSTLTIGSSALSTIAWTAQSILTNSSIHSTGTNPERLAPQSTGVYQFSAQTLLTDGGGGTYRLIIRDSSGTDIASARGSSAALSGGPYLTATGVKRFDAIGGYGLVVLSLASWSTVSLSTGVGVSWFAMTKL